MILVTKWFGVFLCDGEKIVKKILMPKNSDEIGEKLAEMQKGGVLKEEVELATNQEKLLVSERRQSSLGKPTYFDSSFIKAEDYGFDSKLMHDAMIKLGKLRTSEPISRDKSAVQAVRTLDTQIESINQLNERIHEWYGIYFPELADYAKDKKYCELISIHKTRNEIIEELGIDIESIGSDMDEEDLSAIASLADQLCTMYELKDETEQFISEIIEESCPNLSYLIGGPLTARLISLSGGLERLASLPSSTIQLLGAEKAMFRHLKSGKKSRKHGIIDQYPEVHRSPYWQRGNIARALAGKISIAAKVDMYKGEFIGEQLHNELNARIEEISKKYPNPPKPKNNKKGKNFGKKRR